MVLIILINLVIKLFIYIGRFPGEKISKGKELYKLLQRRASPPEINDRCQFIRPTIDLS